MNKHTQVSVKKKENKRIKHQEREDKLKAKSKTINQIQQLQSSFKINYYYIDIFYEPLIITLPFLIVI